MNRTALLLAVQLALLSGCVSVASPVPNHAITERYHPQMERVLDRLHPHLPNGTPRFRYVVWQTADDVIKHPVAIDVETRIIYIHQSILGMGNHAAAFAVAHEIGHYVNDRYHKNQLRAIWVGGSASAGGLVGYLTVWWAGAATGGAALLLIPILFTDSMMDSELEADRFAVRLLNRAGYDTAHAVNLWCRMFVFNDLARSKPSASHPNGLERCRVMKKELTQ